MKSSILALFYFSCCIIKGYSTRLSVENEKNSCVAHTRNNQINGYESITYDGAVSYCSFLGMKYATADRYKEAVPYISETKIIDATKDLPKCIQINGDSIVGEEDCLYLSVHTPDLKGSLPVLVYIHGGGFAEGSAQLTSQKPDFFMETKKIVMVFIQYRIGALGFVDFNSDRFPSNLGLKDQVEALRWVKDNIDGFGGNPEQVTIQGESAGAASVSLHLFSSLSKGLFRAAISESGSACSTWAVLPKEWARNRLRLLAKYVGCAVDDIPIDARESADLTARCLKTKTAEQLVNATLPFALPYNGMNSFLPVLERVSFNNTFLSHIPWSSPVNQVPWISGVNSNEAGMLIYIMGKMMNVTGKPPLLNVNIPQALYFDYSTLHPQEISTEIKEYYGFTDPVTMKEVPGVTKAITDGTFSYPNYLCHRIHAGSSSYNYYFNYVPSAQRHRGEKGVFHSEELQYLFIRGEQNIRMTGSSEDKEVSKKMVDLWVSFVQTSKPSADGVVWDPYSTKDNHVLIFGNKDFHMGTDPNLGSNIFWDLLPFRELMP